MTEELSKEQLIIVHIYLDCDDCGHKEYYEDECGFFTDGKFWGVGENNMEKIICNNCLEESA